MYLIFYASLPKIFHAGFVGYLYSTAVYVEDEQEWEVNGILRHKRSGEEGSIWLYIQETANLKLFDSLK